VDTRVLARYLTGDHPDMAQRAAAIIDRESEVFVPAVVLAETAHVLRSFYRLSRELVVDTLIAFLRRRNVLTLGFDKTLAIQALLLGRPSSRVSFVDALLWTEACSAGIGIVYSFDRRFPSDGIERRES
jgi:predicted nucleic-acid-binding protein